MYKILSFIGKLGERCVVQCPFNLVNNISRETRIFDDASKDYVLIEKKWKQSPRMSVTVGLTDKCGKNVGLEYCQ